MSKIICFYIGYTHDFNGNNVLYGSELALHKLAEQFVKHGNSVHVFGPCLHKEVDINGVSYRNSNKLESFGKENSIDVMILSRYMVYFLDFKIRSKKTYIWLHDAYIMPWWNGNVLPQWGKYLIENLMPSINGLIVLCDWHKQDVLNRYEIDPNKVFIIGNAINDDIKNVKNINNISNDIVKQKNRFIWTSAPERGLDKLVKYFHEIKKYITDAELYIYRGKEGFSTELLNEIENCQYIHYKGKMDNNELIKEFYKSDVWFYPTEFHETYCISALEAQLTGCLCITSNIGALSTTVGPRGIIVSNDKPEEVVRTVVNILGDTDKKNEYIKKGQEWANSQTWENRVLEWLHLFETS